MTKCIHVLCFKIDSKILKTSLFEKEIKYFCVKIGSVNISCFYTFVFLLNDAVLSNYAVPAVFSMESLYC